MMPMFTTPGDEIRPLLGADAVNPAWLAWKQGAVLGLAREIAKREAFDLLPILGDALEEAGCDESGILVHCRRPGIHSDSCWLIDLLLVEQPIDSSIDAAKE
jgi:hypothetical protein